MSLPITVSSPLCSSYTLDRLHLLWVCRSPSPYDPLSPNIAREVCSYLYFSPCLVAVLPMQLVLFPPALAPTTSLPLQTTVQVDSFSVWTWVSDRSLLVCGSRATYLIVGETVTVLAATAELHCCAGMHFFSPLQTVYVFGGYNKGVRCRQSGSAQRRLRSSPWEAKGGLQPGR